MKKTGGNMTETATPSPAHPDSSNPNAVRVFCAHAVQVVMRRAVADLAQSDGLHFAIEVGTMGGLKGRIGAGERADIAVLSEPVFAPFAAEGVLQERTDLARTEIAMAVRPGAAVPDISNPDAFRAALLAAGSIACTNPASGGTAGVHLSGVFAQMGIADEVKAKSRYQADGNAVSKCVADGGADFGLTLVSEIVCVPGAIVGAVLPDAIQCPTTYAAGIFAQTQHRDAVRALISHLASDALAPLWRENGFTLPERPALPIW
jgi:molybdate transport system substrate-binding protein